ncbi:MAG: hypothetical protein AB1452_15975 [Pseudomonadota bacterium]
MPSPVDAKLDKLVNLERAEREEQIYLNAPDECDLCNRSFEGQTYMIDCQIEGQGGAWGNVCSVCYEKAGAGIAWGKGQLYKRRADGEWLLVAGFPPKESA